MCVGKTHKAWTTGFISLDSNKVQSFDKGLFEIEYLDFLIKVSGLSDKVQTFSLSVRVFDLQNPRMPHTSIKL